jgi:hypothetical protein
MIRCTLILTVAFVVAFAQKPSRDAKSGGLSIPAGAVEVSPGVYKHTDPNGKESIYRKTPFGIVKMNSEAKPAETIPVERGNPFGDGKSASSKITPPIVNVIEEGDMVRFERSTPFGPSRWTRKKSELNEDEREMLERSRTAKQGKPGPKE